MLSEVIELSKIDVGKIELNLHPINLVAILNEIVHLFQTQSNEKMIKLNFSNHIEKDIIVYNILSHPPYPIFLFRGPNVSEWLKSQPKNPKCP